MFACIIGKVIILLMLIVQSRMLLAYASTMILSYFIIKLVHSISSRTCPYI